MGATISETALGYLLSVGLRGSLLIGLAALATLLLGRRSAGLRHLLWAAGLAGLMMVTGLSWLLPAWRLQALPAQPLSVVGLLLDAGGGALAVSSATTPSSGSQEAPAAALGPALADGGTEGWVPVLLFLIWGAAALWLLLRLLVGLWAAGRLVRQARPVTDAGWLTLAAELSARAGLRRPVSLRLSGAVSSPVTAGVLRPVVLLPAQAEPWEPARLRAVLAHEIGHVQRRDCASQLLARVATAFHWWNPLVWLAERRMRVERELACDDHVLADGTRASDYAEYLIAIGRVADGRGQLQAALVPGAFIVGCSKLAGRLQVLLEAGRSHHLLRRRTAALVAGAALLLALPAACLTGNASAADDAARLVYRTEAARLPETLAVLAGRLRELGLSGARVSRQSADQLVIELPGQSVPDRAATRAALERKGLLILTFVDTESELSRRLAEHVAGDGRARQLGIQVKDDRWRDDKGAEYRQTFLQGSRSALQSYLATLPATLRPPADRRLVLGRLSADDPSVYRTVALDRTRSLEIRRFVDAETSTLQEGSPSERVTILVTLSPEDGARLQALTSENVGRRMAIELDEQDVWSTPVVMSPIAEHFMLISPSPAAETERLTAGFRAGALPARLELVSEERQR